MEIEVVVSRARVTGSIMMEDSEGTLRPARGVQINLKPKRVGPTEYVETDTGGFFHRDMVGRNEYVVEFPNLPSGAYIARLMQDKRDVLEDGLDVQSTDLHMDGLISSNGGMIEGTVSNSEGDGVVGAVVALVPDARLQKHLYRAVRSADDGRFVFWSIPPGSYQLFAWSTLNGAAHKNSQFMKQYEGRGQPATVEKKGRLTIPVKLLD
jgi:hypothetical protein